MTTANEKLYIQLYNIHGLIRGENLELGRDADTGGQTKYVLELAKTLSKNPLIRKVEIVTRLIGDKEVSQDYSVTPEKINDKLSIIRIGAGGKKYIRKELLWNHLEEFIDKSIKYIKSRGELPDVMHSHYADAGYVCTQLTKFFGVPLIHTGHSLGMNKLNNLLANGMTEEEIEKRYRISKRISAEEEVIFHSDRIIVSTNQEIEKQYGLYKNFSREKFVVIPPSIDLEKFYPFNQIREWDEEHQKIRDGIRNELWKFFTNMNKPIILSLCRPEKRKNISGLIQAYGEDEELQQKANLAIFAGIRKDITQMPDIEREVLTEILLLMDKYNLYGKMAVPKRHDFEHEVPELYRIAAETRGVFVNSAFNEPFGLTLIEAAASGIPIVATDDGGPKDIIANLKNGRLVDVSKPENISRSIKAILDDNKTWDEFSLNGTTRIKHFYSWDAHTGKYLETVQKLVIEKSENPKTFIETGKRLFSFSKIMVFDIDDTLLGDAAAAAELMKLIERVHGDIGFGVATGRTIDSAKEVLRANNLIMPDVIISSVGAEIYYRTHDKYEYARGWDAHISQQWKRDKIAAALSHLEYLTLQEKDTQRPFKLSYYLSDKFDIEEVSHLLIKNKLKANLILSHESYLDILPPRASKGRAIRYLGYRWNIPHECILTAGDSGNDEDMLTGELLGVVVANHTPELSRLKGRRRIYFSDKKYAEGILDGINFYNFTESRYNDAK